MLDVVGAARVNFFVRRMTTARRMEPKLSYLLAVGQPYPGTSNRPYLMFTPAGVGTEPFIGFIDGFFPHDCGGACIPADVLKRPVYLDMLRQFGLAWFISYIERMATGECFTLDELQRVYSDHMGHKMETSSATGHFSFMERPKDITTNDA